MKPYSTPRIDLVGSAARLIQVGGGDSDDAIPNDHTPMLSGKLEEN